MAVPESRAKACLEAFEALSPQLKKQVMDLIRQEYPFDHALSTVGCPVFPVPCHLSPVDKGSPHSRL